ncbi:scyllo-inosamine-4-phosphate amidinotransferase [Mycobacterium sp. SMC-8]|uniref:scyllo-inosamine-4-phosphate amidinotransferase n=1 Tax=Mycobacterium sp. SMC-8 TaxID=2857060 RepID=UPI0021B2B906|nr:scyllo-inosamine-4-phosphate amidinotransferase [Mycobacterium sp. SMC-8]
MTNARVPRPGRDLHAVEFPGLARMDDIPSGPYPDWVVDETNDELEALCVLLANMGVTVRRPMARDTAVEFSTPNWTTEGFYDYCPRDGFLTIGNTILESPMVLRSRHFEGAAYRALFQRYSETGARWVVAPKPELADSMFDPSATMGSRLANHEPAFDAANILRFGTDVLYLISDSGNEAGMDWLRTFLGSSYEVHAARNLYASTHVDSTLVPLRPGLLLTNPSRVTEENMPSFLKDWQRLPCPDLVDTGFVGPIARASRWIGMNILMVGPGIAVVDRRQPDLIRVLEVHGVDVVPAQLTHARTLGGGFHCVTLDVRRAGEAADYR